MPRGSLLLTNHSSYASQLTIPRGKLEALDDFASSLETKGRSSTLYHFFPFSKNRCSHPHKGRSLFNGDLKVIRHTH